MVALNSFAFGHQKWSLEEFVQIANQLIPEVLVDISGQGSEEINPRLVRYYTTQGLVDKPLREGREARYLFRHLLQVLVVRRLLAEGYSTGVIISRVVNVEDAELRALLQGGLQLMLEAPNPALAYLEDLQRSPRQSVTASPARFPVPNAPLPTQWSRLEVSPGLELHIRHDVQLPGSAEAWQSLLNQIRQLLIKWNPRSR